MKEPNRKDLLFLISILDNNDKRELVKEFSEVFKDMMKNGELSKSWYYKMMQKEYAPSDELILKACDYEDAIITWIITRVSEKMNETKRILEEIEEEEQWGNVSETEN